MSPRATVHLSGRASRPNPRYPSWRNSDPNSTCGPRSPAPHLLRVHLSLRSVSARVCSDDLPAGDTNKRGQGGDGNRRCPLSGVLRGHQGDTASRQFRGRAARPYLSYFSYSLSEALLIRGQPPTAELRVRRAALAVPVVFVKSATDMFRSD